jgi:hypothetical protein
MAVERGFFCGRGILSVYTVSFPSLIWNALEVYLVGVELSERHLCGFLLRI